MTKVFVLELSAQTSEGSESLYFVGFDDYMEVRLTSDREKALRLRDDQAEQLKVLINAQTRFTTTIWELTDKEDA
jgi:hypothetical protein